MNAGEAEREMTGTEPGAEQPPAPYRHDFTAPCLASATSG